MFRDLLAITETEWNLLLSNWLPDLIFADFYDILKNLICFAVSYLETTERGNPLLRLGGLYS